MAPLAFLAIYAGGWWFQGVVVAGAVVMAWEWENLCCRRFSSAGALLALTGGGVALLGVYSPVLCFLLIALSLLGIVALCHRDRRRDMRWLMIGVFYITIPVWALIWIRLSGMDGLVLSLWLFCCVWATDTGAYVCGRTIGGPKLIPRISPNKTWAGLIGGGGWAMLVGGVFAVWNEYSLAGFLLCSLILAFVAQAGDLWESWVKRCFGAKDSSAIIPGHGGLLDRVDGLLFASVFVALLSLLREESMVFLW